MSELKSTDSNDLFNASDRTIPVSDIRALKDSLVANRIKRLTGNGPVLTIQEREAKDYLNTIRKNLREENEHTLFNDTSSYDARTYTSFSGSEATVSAVFPFRQPVVIGQCQTITYSLFRPMTPVYNLGKAKPSGYVRGPRTIAGSIIFTVFDRHVLLQAFHRAFSKESAPCLEKGIMPDELPPFDLQITFMNEYGQSSLLIVHGVHLTSEGQVMSIEDMITENTMQYLASDITLMRPNVFENQ